MRSRKGFTLVELLVVIIIVGVLAAVAIPLMTGYVNRAKKTEAISGMGTVRTGERAYYSENNAYKVIAGVNDLTAIGIQTNDLSGRYYSADCYTVSAAGVVTCNPASSTAPKASEVNALGSMTMAADGTLGGNYQ